VQKKGALPPPNWKATPRTQVQAGGRLTVGVTTTLRRKTSPRPFDKLGTQPRAFRLPAPVVVGEVGRRSACERITEGTRISGK